MPESTATPLPAIDCSLLLADANQRFGASVDADIRGTPITQLDTLFFGAYGPAVKRAMAAVAARGPGPLDHEEFTPLANAAFAAAQDKYFNDQPITSYEMLMSRDGYGPEVFQLACLVSENPDKYLLAPG